MNLLEKALTRETGLRAPDRAGPYTAVSATGQVAPGPWGPHRPEYQTALAYEVRFYANEAEYPDALKRAQRVMLHGMYAPALAYVDQAMHDISNGDYEAAMMRLSELRDALAR